MTIEEIAAELGATPSDIPGLWNLPAVPALPELTTNQLLDIWTKRSVTYDTFVDPAVKFTIGTRLAPYDAPPMYEATAGSAPFEGSFFEHVVTVGAIGSKPAMSDETDQEMLLRRDLAIFGTSMTLGGERVPPEEWMNLGANLPGDLWMDEARRRIDEETFKPIL